MSDNAVNVDTVGISDRVLKEDATSLGVRLRTYEGVVSRQSLNDFCVNLAETSRRELERQQKLLADDSKLSDEQYETLMLSCASLSGGIAQLRAVTEWARKQHEEVSPFRNMRP